MQKDIWSKIRSAENEDEIMKIWKRYDFFQGPYDEKSKKTDEPGIIAILDARC